MQHPHLKTCQIRIPHDRHTRHLEFTSEQTGHRHHLRRCRSHGLPELKHQRILDEKISEYAALMRVSRQTAQRDFTDEHLIVFAQALALSLSDEPPGANLIEFERTISMPVAAIRSTTSALAEALKVTHINLDDKEAVSGLSLLSTLGMICADASAFLVPVPRPLLLRIARYLDSAATSIAHGANLPDGLHETNRRNFDVLADGADGIRALANTDDGDARRCGAPPTPPQRTNPSPSVIDKPTMHVETRTHPVRTSGMHITTIATDHMH